MERSPRYPSAEKEVAHKSKQVNRLVRAGGIWVSPSRFQSHILQRCSRPYIRYPTFPPVAERYLTIHGVFLIAVALRELWILKLGRVCYSASAWEHCPFNAA